MAPASPHSGAQWPPRSPREAQLSTPGGRDRYRRMLNQTSPSPSPSRGSRLAPAFQLADGDDDDDEEDEEDEETLQLKLQEIQARLKLKKLQNARMKEAVGKSKQESQMSSASSSAARKDENLQPPRSAFEVPASPIRKVQAPQVQTSPSRVLLGIDKGLTASDISLKRAPSLRRKPDIQGAEGGYLRRSRTPNPANATDEPARPMTFNERLASSRQEESQRAERQLRIQQMRSNAFGIGKEEMEGYKIKAVEIPDEPLQAQVFSREEILSQTRVKKSNTATGLGGPRSRSPDREPATDEATFKQTHGLEDSRQIEASSYEPFSSFHLSKRILPHSLITRHVSAKTAYNVKDLLRVVKAPSFSLPDVETDIVVYAIVAKKSEPRSHKPVPGKTGGKAEDRGKYMVINLVDLEYELDLFLFGTGFTRFWKLTEGTVIAILNPDIMPPPPGRTDTGRFSLVINSDADTILEIGASRDLGFCQSVKKDGSICDSWVNKKKTNFCEYHSSEAIKKQRGTRMEVNNSGFGSGRGGGSKWKPHGKERFGGDKSSANGKFDRESGSHIFATRSHSAADLIDGKDRGPSDRRERAEFVKRGMEAKEKEREMMKKLGQIGGGAGREYMQRAGSRTDQVATNSTASQPNGTAPPTEETNDLKSFGLQPRSHSAVHLSPVKRKRADISQAGSVGSSGAGGFGWGSNLKDKLTRMKDGEKLVKEAQPPMRKKTRFVTEKGIREAGRESLGTDLRDFDPMEDDDDDELVIVR